MTPFQAVLTLAGLSRGDAARLLRAREDSINKWRAERGDAPEGVMRDLKALIVRQERAARIILEQGAESRLPIFMSFMEPDIGWPSHGAWAAMAARVAAGSPPPGLPPPGRGAWKAAVARA
jgi:hypothetical protein